MKKFLMLVTVLGLSFTGRASAQDSNRNEVRANLEKDGWTVVWGKNFTEADWALGTKAIAESIVARSPAPFLAWFDAVLQQNFTKIQQNLKGVAKADLERWLLQSLESKSIVTYKGFKIQAGFATYNREKRVIVEVPENISRKQRKLIQDLAEELGVDTHPQQAGFMDKLRGLLE